MIKGPLEIDFASRFPPRHLEATRLRGFEASRLCDLQIFGKKVKLDFNVFMQLWGHFGGTLGSIWECIGVTLDS